MPVNYFSTVVAVMTPLCVHMKIYSSVIYTSCKIVLESYIIGVLHMTLYVMVLSYILCNIYF